MAGGLTAGLVGTNPGPAAFADFGGGQLTAMLTKELCQNDGLTGMLRLLEANTKEYKEIELLAATVSSVPNRISIDPTHGSMYYKRMDVPSKFFREKLIPKVAIGEHRFYVEKA